LVSFYSFFKYSFSGSIRMLTLSYSRKLKETTNT
jgi:hypothetical protein